MLRIGFVLIGIGTFWASTVPAVAAAAKCTSVQAQCAIEVGGRCDPATGRWEYGRGISGRGSSGGSNRFGAFDACVSRKLGHRK
jgi:hypothetical protein